MRGLNDFYDGDRIVALKISATSRKKYTVFESYRDFITGSDTFKYIF